MSSPDIQEITIPDTVEELLGRDETRPDVPWVVIVWNDPVNTIDYVIFVFQKLFAYSRAKATRLTYQVHNEGKSVVTNGAREKCEADVSRLHAYGLWATMQKDD